MKLTFHQSFQVAYHIVETAISTYRFEDKLLNLEKIYIFNFDLRKTLSPHSITETITFTKQFYRLLLLNIFGQREEKEWKQCAIETSHKTKHYYCKLMEKLTTHKHIDKLQKILFSITLIAKGFFDEVIDNNWRQSESFEEEQVNEFQIQQYVYIVLTFQTAGNLISPKAFKYLKNKYIKRIIFRSNGGTLGIINSLRHIKKQLSVHEAFIGERKGREKQSTGFSSGSLVKFIRDNLKTNFTIVEKPKVLKDPIISSMEQTFYHKKKVKYVEPQKRTYKLMSSKVSTRQLSCAALTNYKIKQEHENSYKNNKKSKARFETTGFPKKLPTKFQLMSSDEEKKEKKNVREDWDEIIFNLKNESEKTITKIQRSPLTRNHIKTNEKNRVLQSQPSLLYAESAFRQVKNLYEQSDTNDRKMMKNIMLDPVSNENEELNNTFYNLKSPNDKGCEKKVEIGREQWKTIKQLRRKENDFREKCKERKQKIKDSFLNIPHKIF